MKTNQVRIIAGKWRGRKIVFPEQDMLRPTHDRIRETLFNWLMPYLPDAKCLDLFSGSGAIGFEAVSRGAAHAVLVDSNTHVVDCLERNKKSLGAQEIDIIHARVLQAKVELPLPCFDIVFLDPPFYHNMLQSSCCWLAEHHYVKPGTMVYLESEINYEKLILPESWQIIKNKRTATVMYSLAEVQ